jgi:predicted small integral membrane protein
MTTRASKLLLLAGVAAMYTIVVFNNLTDFNSNYEIVRHVLMMDTTFPNNHGMWRALNAPLIQLAFYLCIIAWEIVTMALLWWGVIGLVHALRLPVAAFESAKRIPLTALTLSLVMWLVAFLTVGGEWFLMWQSHVWNGQDAAFRNFTVVGIVLLFLLRPETETQP